MSVNTDAIALKSRKYLGNLVKIPDSIHTVTSEAPSTADFSSQIVLGSDLAPLDINNKSFRVQLKEKQAKDALIANAMRSVQNRQPILRGKYKCVLPQLRFCDGVLTESD
eukprot:gene3829-15121_t